jgi:hypothetical protein
MSTRATYTVYDRHDIFTTYIHTDGYPSGALRHIANALPWAWPLPRFEAADFAAAIIAGNKEEGGGSVYITRDKYDHGDLAYNYNITVKQDRIWVVIEDMYKNEVVGCGFLDVLQEMFSQINMY